MRSEPCFFNQGEPVRPLLLLLVPFALDAGSGAWSQKIGQAELPTLPTAASIVDRTAFNRALRLASKGQFDAAAASARSQMLARTAKVYANFISVPNAQEKACREAVERAIRTWSTEFSGKPGQLSHAFTLVPTPNGADVMILFERWATRFEDGLSRAVCGDAKIETMSGRRFARVNVSLNVPQTETPHSLASLTHAVGQGLGAYLGLGPSDDPSGFMGPDRHDSETAVAPNSLEVGAVRQIRQAQASLLDLAIRKVAVSLPQPVLSLERTEIDAGEVWRGEKPHYTFRLKNAGAAPLEIVAKPNCGCTVARFDTIIPPGGTGTIEADLDTTTFKGRIAKTVDVLTNELDRPKTILRLLATVRVVVNVAPGELIPVPLKPGVSARQVITLRMNDAVPAAVTEVSSNAPFAVVTLKPRRADGAYPLEVEISPDAPPGRTTVTITGKTTSARQPVFTINLACEKGILASPSSLNFGTVTAEVQTPSTRILFLARRDQPFKITGVRTGDPSLEAMVAPVREGLLYRVTLAYKGGWPAGATKRTLTIETDDPAQPRIEVPITASVLAAGGTKVSQLPSSTP